MGIINNIEGLLNDVLLDYERISEAVHASISESIKLSDLDKLYEVWRYGDRAEPLYRLLQEKAKKGADAFREYLHGMLYFEDDNELIEALAEGPIKTLIAGALSLVQQLEPGMLVTRDNRNGAVVYQVEKGYTCRCILDGARVEVYTPAWSGECPINYDKLERWALVYVNDEWWQVHGKLRRNGGHFELSVRRVRSMHRNINTEILIDPDIKQVIAREELADYYLVPRKVNEEKGGTE